MPHRVRKYERVPAFFSGLRSNEAAQMWVKLTFQTCPTAKVRVRQIALPAMICRVAFLDGYKCRFTVGRFFSIHQDRPQRDRRSLAEPL